jgi:hexosaminidase
LKRAILALLGAVALLAGAARAEPVLMPLAKAMTQAPGALVVRAPFVATATGCPKPLIARALARFRKDVGGPHASTAGPHLSIRCRAPGAGYLTLEAREAYRLDVTAQGVTIDADGPAGALHGLATLRQLASGGGQVPFVHIDDAPRFAWRGLMIDTSRHFMALPTVRRQIDAMERVKLNVLHLHLSDNEGFRVESRLYPKVTSAAPNEAYSQAEIRALIAYAADRGVRIVPEFDVPAHTGALVAAYPELAAKSDPNDPLGAFNRALNPTSDATYKLLDALLGEMADLFPDREFHIGGDEVNDAAWAHDPSIAAFMAAHGLKSRTAMEAWFHAHIRATLARHGKTTVGWEEIAATPIPKDVILQSWRYSNATASAVAAGHRTIVSAGYYLDQLMQADAHYAIDPTDLQADGFTPAEVAFAAKASPLAAAAVNPLALQPLPPLTPEQEKLVIGGEAPLWSEIVTDEMLDARFWPRAAAIAERYWSPREVRDRADLIRRLPVIADQLERGGLQAEAGRARMAERLSPGNAAPVLTFLEAVSPSRNATHNHAIQAMVHGQRNPPPQPLTALADAAPVDGVAALRFTEDARRLAAGDAAAAPALRAQLQRWRDNAPKFADAARGHPDLEAALPVSADVATLADIGLKSLDAIADHRPLDPEARAQGAAALDRAAKSAAASARPVFAFLQPQPPADLWIAIAPAVGVLFAATPPAR